MKLANYYSEQRSGQDSTIEFTRQQASAFAKDVAGDFNPLHDVETKKFCVPGDLLFSVALEKMGLSKQMTFTFQGMVSDGIQLNFPAGDDSQVQINDTTGKEYLSVEREGESSHDKALISQLTERYVEFSGHTFPHILMPLMEKHNVMINPARPLVIYENMSIDLDRLDFVEPELEMTDCLLDVAGKRGTVKLQFCLKSGGDIVGRGEKQMALGGLREYDEAQIGPVVSQYDEYKANYQAAK